MRASLALGLLALAACAAPPPRPPEAPPPPPPAAPAPPPPPHELSLPPVALTLIDSPTAQTFHIVDELSGWYGEAHGQYAEWASKEMPLSDTERAMLAKHAKLRAKRRRGGLEQAFEVNASTADAVRAALEKKLVSEADAADEQALLEHFQRRLAALFASTAKPIADLEARLSSSLPRAAPVLARVGRFCELTETLPIRAVLVPNPLPARAEGRATRTSIVLEVPSSDDPLATLFHHLFHAILQQRRGTIAMAVGKCDEAVDDATVEDGLAYALAPGILGAGDGDLLRDLVDADRDATLRDPRVRAERLGLAVRTELSAALEGGHETIGSFMPKACDAWANVAKP